MSGQKTTLLMLPGLDGTGLVFEPLLASLPATIDPHIVCYPADQPMSLQEHVDFAKKQCPPAKPFILLAESFSGPVALQLMASPPQNLAAVIFVATFAHYPRPFLLDIAQHLPQRALLKLFSTSLFSRFFCLGSASTDAIKLFQRALASVQREVLSHRLKLLAELSPPEPAYRGPCLYLQASNDRLVPERAATQLQRYLPQLQVETLPGPHIILLADPHNGARAICDYVATLKGESCQD